MDKLYWRIPGDGKSRSLRATPMAEARTNRFETKYTDTYYAPAGRASESDLQESVSKLTHNPILDATMEILGSWVLAVNQQRQILAINAKLIEELGIEDPGHLLGLRPGEALGCKYAYTGPDGCGTGQTCSTCGAAIAMVTAQQTGAANDQTCVLTTVKGKTSHDSVFSVRCVPVKLEEEDILLVCMHDISTEQRRKALERTYLHDTSNLLSALSASIERLRPDASPEQLELIDNLKECSRTLIREVRIQRLFCTNGDQPIEVNSSEIWPDDVLKRIKALIRNHPAAHKRKISVYEKSSIAPALSDMTLVTRILVNMIINALEACQDDRRSQNRL